MKKHLTKILIAAMLMTVAMAFAACGGDDSPYVGTWEATKIAAYGVEMDPAEADMEFVVEFKDDGTVTATTNGEADGEGTWKETDDGVSIESSGETMNAVSNDDGTLTLDMEGVEITMEKK